MSLLNNRALFLMLAVLAPIFLSVCLGKDDLASSLSPQARVLYPGSPDFIEANTRWSAIDPPTYRLIVQAATEEDVQETILHANKDNTPFLAISGGHGTTSTLGKLQNGIGIHLSSKLNGITLVDNNTAALIQGGVLNGDLIPYLWSRNKQTATTGCDCVGYIAPILGGGHGWLRGRYGLAADQLISARLVLANGSVVEVSDTENPELFWAVRGAGHNFGIVTEAKIKVYDVPAGEREWTVNSFVFTQEKLESVFEVANKVLDDPDRPDGMTWYFVMGFDEQVDAENPLLTLWVYHPGLSIPSKYTDPLHALSPTTVTTHLTDLTGTNAFLLADKGGIACANGLSRKLIPISVTHYHLASLRRAFTIFSTLPTSLRGSVIFLENYDNTAVAAVDADSTAYPDRGGRVLIAPLLNYSPGNSSLDAEAFEVGTKLRDAFVEGSGEGDGESRLVTYVNYARGDESLQAVYGYEEWRLERLRALKRVWDPQGRFGFYAPIV